MRPLLLATAAALACFAGRAAANLREPPLLGASLTWAVNRNFRSGARRVTFTLRSAFAYGVEFGSTRAELIQGNPMHLPGDRVRLKEPFSLHGQRFGVLSIVQCLDSNCAEKVIVNINNDFVVQTHDTVKRFTAGILEHEFTVPANVVAVLAYLTFRPDSESSINPDLAANGERYSLYARYASATGTGGTQDWSALLPPAVGATWRTNSWEFCSGNPTVFCTSTKDCEDQGLPPSATCGIRNGQGSYKGSEYFGSAFLNNFPKLANSALYVVAATFAQLCCSQCSIGQSQFGCGAEKPRLKNYYSPVPAFPLAVFQGIQPGVASVRLKVADYDGHILRLLPLRSQNPNFRIATIESPSLNVNTQVLQAAAAQAEWRTKTLNAGKYKFHDYFPAEGPIVRLEKPSIPVDASTIIDGRLPATRQVLEVQDFLWTDDGIEDSMPNMLAVDTAAVTMGIDPDNDKPTATTGGSTSQVVFSAFFQGNGPSQCPSNRLPQWNPEIPTEIECTHNDQNCFVALKATTGSPARTIKIIEAPGFERLRIDVQNFYQTCANFQGLESRPAGVTRWDVGALCGPYGDLSPCGCCENRAACPAAGVCAAEILSKTECRYNMYNYNISHVGEQRVMCFVATAEYCKQAGQETQPSCSDFETCYSQPLCVRFNIVGHRPKFVSPTPLQANSLDALGRVVPGRTDVAACLGSPLPLSIMAVDEDSNDQVRIFLDDEIRLTSFFSNDESIFPSSSCGTFKPFAGVRLGVNAGQDSIVHLLNAEWDSTITAQLNPKIAFRRGNASQDILYKLTLESNNGIENRGIPDCGTSQTCRQRLLNMPRILCGYAYDNSRSRYARWVGRRAHPELHRDARDYVDDHSLGSYASERHCWKITLQAPPVFITNSTGCISKQGDIIRSTCTPFGAGTNPGSIIDTTKNRMAYPNITLSVLTKLDVQFVAFDPNPEDRVQLYVMEDPGIPSGMTVGRSICLPRTAQPIADYHRETCPSTGCGGEDKCECGLTRKCNPGADESLGVAAKGAKCLYCDATTKKCNAPAADNPKEGTSIPFLPMDFLQNPDARQNCPAQCNQASKTSCECTGFCPADLSCNRASIRLQWQPRPEDFGKSFLVCVVARDNSDLCQGQEIQGVTERGWYGEQHCMYLNVVPPAFAFEGPWVEEFVKGSSKAEPYGIYVGCTFSTKLTVRETSAGGASYGGKIIRNYVASSAPADEMEAATNAKGEKKLEVVVTQGKICTDTSATECSVMVDVTPRLGSEGFYFQLCFSAGDQLEMVLNSGICIEDPTLKPCNLHSDCSRGSCLPLCFDLRVEKCRYCIKDGPETLRAVKGQYMIDTNWMRLWTLNADSFGNLGTECKKYFDCAKDVSNVSVIDNPELILPHDGKGKRILWTGVLYSPLEREKAKDVACRFRTGLKSLQHNNPEMPISDGELIIQPGDSVCIGSCDAGTLLSSDGIPTCQEEGGFIRKLSRNQGER